MASLKRASDLFLAVLGFFVTAPLIWFISGAIKLDSAGPAFFRQVRVGRGGKAFHLVKLRTMVDNASRIGLTITVGGDLRITRLGYLLRRTKLDELPQLFNVLNGDMSFVGPRPEVPKYTALYSTEQRKVLGLLPGITDPASIKFRNESELLGQVNDPEQRYTNSIMPEKIAINLDYSQRATIWTDFKVIVKTLKCLFDKSSHVG